MVITSPRTASQSSIKKNSYSTVAQASLILILILLPHSELPISLPSLLSLHLEICVVRLAWNIAQTGLHPMTAPHLDFRNPGVLGLSHHIRLFFIFRKKICQRKLLIVVRK